MNWRIIPGILLIAVLLSCSRVNLPQAEYSEHVMKGYIPVFLRYENRVLTVDDSIIDDFTRFRRYVGELDGFESNTRHCILALEIDQHTPFCELDSIFRLFSSSHFNNVFFLVNNKRDTTGFSFTVPLYDVDHPAGFEIPDTVRFENLLKLSDATILYNGEQIETGDLDKILRKIVFKKESIFLLADGDAKYKDLVLVIEKYNQSRSCFKGLYSELNFNKKYHWLLEYGLYKNEVDEAFKNQLWLLNEAAFAERTVVY